MEVTTGPGWIEIRLGSDHDALALVPLRTLRTHHALRQLTQTFAHTVIALRQPDPPPHLCDAVAFVADWSPDEQDRFLSGFAEAIDESLRLHDPAPARCYLEAMTADDTITADDIAFSSPQFTGDVSGAAADVLAARVGRRPSPSPDHH